MWKKSDYSCRFCIFSKDFIAQYHGKIIPIEVKAEENLKAKSLKAFMDKHADLHAIRFSMSPYKKQDWLTNIPLYGVREMKA